MGEWIMGRLCSSFPLGKVGMGPQLALLPLGRLRWGFLYIMYFSISLWENRYSQQDIYLY